MAGTRLFLSFWNPAFIYITHIFLIVVMLDKPVKSDVITILPASKLSVMFYIFSITGIRIISFCHDQRNDINFEYVDPKTGKSNLQLMKSGRPPIGNDGKPIELHHVIQKESGPMVEIRETTHREYHHQLHGIRGNGESFRNDPTLSKQYKNFRSVYWKWRAAQYAGGKK